MEKCTKCKEKKIIYIKAKLCDSCYNMKLYYENHQFREKQKKLSRDRQRKKRGIDLDLPLLKAEKGKGWIDGSGYKKFTVHGHPNASKYKSHIFEHTLIMSNHLGRALTKNESVHHKNGIKLDNRIENLELWHRGQPSGQRLEDKINWSIKFLEEYGYKVEKI